MDSWYDGLGKSLSLLPKVKMVVSFLQLAIAMPAVYEVTMPGGYQERMEFVTAWLDVEVRCDNATSSQNPPHILSSFCQVILANMVPSECLGDFSMRLVLRVVAPMLVTLAVVVGSAWVQAVYRYFSSPSRRVSQLLRPEKHDFLMGVPAALVIAFCFYPSVSRVVFQSWACTEYKVDDDSESKWYLITDESVRTRPCRPVRLPCVPTALYHAESSTRSLP